MAIKILLYLTTWFCILGVTPSINNTVVYTQQNKPIALGQLYKGYKAMVITFISPDCPLCQSYTRTLNELKASQKNVLFIAVVPGSDKSETNINHFSKQFNFKLAMYTDANNRLINTLKATTTPQCFLFNTNGHVIYQGRIDNWAYAVGKKRTKITAHDLKNAIAQHLAGKPISIPQTKPIGCFIE